jgi:hypothetical protein
MRFTKKIQGGVLPLVGGPEPCAQVPERAGAIAWPRHTVDLLPHFARHSGVTLSPAGACVCHCMWSAVHAAVSCEFRRQQVELPWLQLACGVPMFEYCPGGRMTSSPAIR